MAVSYAIPWRKGILVITEGRCTPETGSKFMHMRACPERLIGRSLPTSGQHDDARSTRPDPCGEGLRRGCRCNGFFARCGTRPNPIGAEHAQGSEFVGPGPGVHPASLDEPERGARYSDPARGAASHLCDRQARKRITRKRKRASRAAGQSGERTFSCRAQGLVAGRDDLEIPHPSLPILTPGSRQA